MTKTSTSRAWTKATIKAAVEERGFALLDVDREYGLRLGTISVTLLRPHRRGEAALEQLLGVPASELFPDRFEAEGARKRPQPKANYRPASRRRQRQIGASARTKGAKPRTREART